MSQNKITNCVIRTTISYVDYNDGKFDMWDKHFVSDIDENGVRTVTHFDGFGKANSFAEKLYHGKNRDRIIHYSRDQWVNWPDDCDIDKHFLNYKTLKIIFNREPIEDLLEQVENYTGC